MTKPGPRLPRTQKELGAWLKQLRGKKSQAAIAAAAGLAERKVMRWEKEAPGPALDLLSYLRALGVTLDPAVMPEPTRSESDELFLRLEDAIVRIERALAGQQAPPDAPRSAGAGP